MRKCDRRLIALGSVIARNARTRPNCSCVHCTSTAIWGSCPPPRHWSTQIPLCCQNVKISALHHSPLSLSRFVRYHVSLQPIGEEGGQPEEGEKRRPTAEGGAQRKTSETLRQVSGFLLKYCWYRCFGCFDAALASFCLGTSSAMN